METLMIKKIGGSLYFRFPIAFVRKYNLKEGDVYSLLPNMDGTILKFIKDDELEVQKQETAADAA
jgi:antitoxin component of MazEF toxin-antitoxin module